MRFFILLLFAARLLFAQSNPDWQTVSNMNEVADLTSADGKLWVATSGGLFSFNPQSQAIQRFTNANGMESVALRAISADDHNQLIAGGDDGIIQVYNLKTDQWTFLYNIQGQPIKDILYRQDTLWVAAGKGLAAFFWNKASYIFKDDFLNFPVLPGAVYCVEKFKGRIWLGSDVGLLSAPSDLSKYTINNPGLWKNYATTNGLPDNQIFALQAVGDTLYVGTSSGLGWIDNALLAYTAANWVTNSSGSFYACTNLYSLDKKLYATNYNNFYSYSPRSGVKWYKTFSVNIKTFGGDDQNNLWLGLDGRGIYTPKWANPLVLDGPAANVFNAVYQSSEGAFWAAWGQSKNYISKGFYVQDAQGWHNYSFSGSGWAPLNSTVALYEDRFGNKWVGSWGAGLMVFKKDGGLAFFNNNTNAGEITVTTKGETEQESIAEATVYNNYFSGIPNNNRYVVIPALKEGPDGRLWVADYGAADDHFLTVIPYNKKGFIDLDKKNWIYFGSKDGLGLSGNGDISCIAFDDFGRVWIGTLSDGVYILDYNHTLSKKSDDEVSHLLIQDNLYSNEIFSIASDHDGIVWIGTAGGLNSFDGVNIYSHVGDPQGLSGPLENRINQIFVDRYNNKWFATSGGVSILRAGKSAWDSDGWLGFSHENSGLVDNDVLSIFVNPQTAQAFIGTGNGLSIYRGSFGQIRADYSQIGIGPNPYRLNRSNGKFIFSNLRLNSTIKIYTIQGHLVRELSPSVGLSDGTRSVDGGRAYWDGKDSEGQTVSSGIYLYMVFTQDGQSAAGKIAVIRE